MSAGWETSTQSGVGGEKEQGRRLPHLELVLAAQLPDGRPRPTPLTASRSIAEPSGPGNMESGSVFWSWLPSDRHPTNPYEREGLSSVLGSRGTGSDGTRPCPREVYSLEGLG